MDESGLRLVTRVLKIICRKGSKYVIVSKTAEQSETITVICCGNASEIFLDNVTIMNVN